MIKAKKRKPVELDNLTFRGLSLIFTKGYPLTRPKLQLTVASSENKPFRQAKAREEDLLRGVADL